MDDIETVIQKKVEADVDFNTSLASLSDEEKQAAISNKKSELLKQEFSSLKEKADKAEKAEQIARDQKIRAEKAEADLKNKGGATPSENDKDLSPKDLYSLMQSKVHEEDVDEVVKAAKLLNKSIPEALKDSVVQTILKTKDEFRKTANAVNTKTARPSSKAVSDDEIVREAAKGNVPEKGSEDAERLFWAKRGGKK